MSVPSIEPLLLRAERRVVQSLGLRARPLAARFANEDGLWKDARVTITTRTWEGDAVGYLRVAIISGRQLTIGSLLGCSRPNRALPVLVADLVMRGVTGEAMVSVDVIPVVDEPASSAPVVTGVHDQAAASIEGFSQRVEAWTTLAAAAMPDPDRADAVRRRQREIMDRLRSTPQTRSLLAAMFGKSWAEEYVGTVLYPQ